MDHPTLRIITQPAGARVTFGGLDSHVVTMDVPAGVFVHMELDGLMCVDRMFPHNARLYIQPSPGRCEAFRLYGSAHPTPRG